ncbi:MAG: discoidin domain-containing protein [Candidatus Latescibacterota bacterium]
MRCWHWQIVVCSLVLHVAIPSYAIDSLGVGWRSGIARWTTAAAESRFLALDQDSIWTWDVRPNGNIGPGTTERRGAVLTPGLVGGVATFLPDAAVLYDGDETTAFDPDDFAQSTDLLRTSPIYIDLGATFRINRIRLFPRLDGEHKEFFPRAFSLGTSDAEQDINLLERKFESVFNFFPSNPNRQPVVEHRFPSRDVRYIRLQARENRRWELAELEIYSDGPFPAGEFVSVPIPATRGGTRPLWGRVRYDGGDIQELPVTVQTRSGPDREPLHYFRFTGIGSDKVRVGATAWTLLDSVERGPIIRNPTWSSWETVTDGQVRSPGTVPFIQFRLFFHVPGIAIKRLVIEYINPPIAERLEAEVTPTVVRAGRDTTFTISLRTRIRRLRTNGSLLPNGDSGFQSLRIATAAQITGVEKVQIDDRDVEYTASLSSDIGAEIRLRSRVLQDGTFVQIVLRAIVFRDATRFDVQAIDRRLADGQLVTVQQSAREEDVDLLSLGGSLVVRVQDERGELPLLDQVHSNNRIITPNGDGTNEVFALSYVLLKLTQPVVAALDIYDLSGVRIRHIVANSVLSGLQEQVWDGRGEEGQRVLPGLYIWHLHIEADAGGGERQGIVGVAY